MRGIFLKCVACVTSSHFSVCYNEENARGAEASHPLKSGKKGGVRVEAKELFKKHTLACLAGGFVIGIAATGVASGLMSFTGSPAFCGTCHSMKHEAWTFAESSHRNLECADCHLPHDNAVHYLFAKGKAGMVDAYHEVVRDYPARIKLSDEGRAYVNGNCVRCHSATMENVHASMGTPGDTGGDCMKCHSSIAHGQNHLEGGIKVE